MFLRLVQMLSAFATSLISLDALAGTFPPTTQVTIVYSPTPNSIPIPALSPAMYLALAFLVAAVLFRAMQNRGHSNLLSVFFSMVVFSALASRTNAKFIDDAFASLPNINLGTQQGGTVVQLVSNATYTLTNTTSISQTINSISLAGDWSLQVPTPPTPRCTAGYALAASTLCYVQFSPPT